jgi:hypothetical protein
VRGMGRTTRMIEEAKLAVARGESVLIIGHTTAYARDLAERVGPGVRFSGWYEAGRTLRGSSLVPYIDHHAWEVGGPNPVLASELERIEAVEAVAIARRLQHVDAIMATTYPGIDLSAWPSIVDGHILMNAHWRCRRVMHWILSPDETAVIADKLESIGHTKAAEFRKARAVAMGIGC